MKIDIPDKYLKEFINMVAFGEAIPAITFQHGEEAINYSIVADHIFKEVAKESSDLLEFNEEIERFVPKNDEEIEKTLEEYDQTRFLDILAHNLVFNYMIKTYGSEKLDDMSQEEYDKIYEDKLSDYEEFIYDEGISELVLDINLEK